MWGKMPHVICTQLQQRSKGMQVEAIQILCIDVDDYTHFALLLVRFDTVLWLQDINLLKAECSSPFRNIQKCSEWLP